MQRFSLSLIGGLVALILLGNNFSSNQSWKKGGYSRRAANQPMVKLAMSAAR